MRGNSEIETAEKHADWLRSLDDSAYLRSLDEGKVTVGRLLLVAVDELRRLRTEVERLRAVHDSTKCDCGNCQRYNEVLGELAPVGAEAENPKPSEGFAQTCTAEDLDVLSDSYAAFVDASNPKPEEGT